MRTALLALFVLTFGAGTPAHVLAQERSAPPQSPPQQPSNNLSQLELNQRYNELVRWLKAYREWEEWTLKWGNRIAYNAAGGIVKERPARPEPPEWLWQDCATLVSADGALREACRILDEWDGLVALILNRRQVGGLSQPTDVEEKSSFLQRVHLTGGWVPAQLPAPNIYLAVGMQVGVVEIGRLTLPAVGVGVMVIDDGQGGHDWKPATVIGLGYRLKSFPFPWVKREASLHLNVARVTIHGMRTLPIGIDPSQNFVGFSLTFKKAR